LKLSLERSYTSKTSLKEKFEKEIKGKCCRYNPLFMEFDLNNVEEVLVKFTNGQEIVFRGRGLEKFRKLVKASPPLQELSPPKPKQPIVVEDASSGSEDAASGSEEKPKPPRKKKGKASQQNGGYNTVSLDYGGGPIAPNVGGTPGIKKGMSPHDIAKEMQRQATATSGIKY
jgi:hypothetical protein